ncbi:MAG: thermonuclease family protein [bacterium]
MQKIYLIGICLVCLLSPKLLIAESWTDLRNSGWEAKPIAPSMVKVVDGDTFYADWNRNNYTESEEKIRLLFVDTPELNQSHKGQDLEFGLPARDFLQDRLQNGPLQLWVSPRFPRDRYQRTLGLLQAEDANVNLLLIGLGHSLFDARYQLPTNFDSYIDAEARAYEEKRGIWSTYASRRRYLKRLANEGRSVYSKTNRRYVTKLQKAESVDLARYDKRFIKLAGRLERRVSKGSYIELLLLENGVEVVVRQKYQDRLPSWQFGDQILVEGFVQKYRDKWQVQLFRGVSAQ